MKEAEKQSERDQVSRREFFSIAGNAAVAVTAVGGGIVTWKYLWPNVLFEPPSRFRAGSIEEFPPGSVRLNPEYRVFIFRDKKGYFYTVSAVCTHLGCTVDWKADGIQGHPNGVITCPCHGSVFDDTGLVISGPAPKTLDHFRIYLEEGQLVVDTAEQVSEEEMILRV